MNKNILYKGTIIGITFSFLYIMKSAYLEQEGVLISEINSLFKESILKAILILNYLLIRFLKEINKIVFINIIS